MEFVKHDTKRIEDEDKFEYDDTIPADSVPPAKY
jgi:hypothetical protein